MSEDILQPNQPAKFEARNMRPRFKRLRSGDIFLAEIEIDEAVWNQLRTVPENALLEVVLWHHDGDPEPAQTTDKPKPKEPKGPHGEYFRYLFAHDFQNYPDLIEKLDCAGDQIRLRLHDVFDVSSLTFVSPAQFEEFLKEQGLHSLIALSRQAQAKLEEAA